MSFLAWMVFGKFKTLAAIGLGKPTHFCWAVREVWILRKL